MLIVFFIKQEVRSFIPVDIHTCQLSLFLRIYCQTCLNFLRLSGHHFPFYFFRNIFFFHKANWSADMPTNIRGGSSVRTSYLTKKLSIQSKSDYVGLICWSKCWPTYVSMQNYRRREKIIVKFIQHN